MKAPRSAEIICVSCGKESLLVKRPVYEGLKKTGETWQCAACGHIYTEEAEIPFQNRQGPAIFTNADRSPEVRVFDAGEQTCLCRYCRHYVVNPFTQWCGTHKKEVAATDSCAQFEKRSDPPADSASTPVTAL